MQLSLPFSTTTMAEPLFCLFFSWGLNALLYYHIRCYMFHKIDADFCNIIDRKWYLMCTMIHRNCILGVLHNKCSQQSVFFFLRAWWLALRRYVRKTSWKSNLLESDMHLYPQLLHIPHICHFLHGQNFCRVKFTPKNANFLRKIC